MSLFCFASTDSSGKVRFDRSYLTSPDGLLKIGVIFFSLIGVICAASSHNSAAGFYDFIAGAAICCSGSLLLFYFFRFVHRVKIAWYAAEAIYCGITCLLFVIGMICMFATPQAMFDPASVAAGIFAIPAIGCLGVDAFKKYSAWRGGNLGPGQDMHTLENPDSQVSTPAY